MIHTERVHQKISLDTDVFDYCVKRAKMNAYEPVLLEMANHIYSRLGLALKSSNYFAMFYEEQTDSEERRNAELFLLDGDIYFFSYKSVEYEYFEEEDFFENGINLMIFSKHKSELSKKLNRFKETIVSSLVSSDMWYEYNNIESPKSIEFIKTDSIDWAYFSSNKELYLKYSLPEYSEEELTLSKFLANKDLRDLLFFIKRSIGVRKDDLINRYNKNKEVNIEEMLIKLSKYNLIKKKILIQCKRTKSNLTRIEVLGREEKKMLKNLTCPNCGDSFMDELHSDIYSATDLANTLLNSSHWMTIVVTDTLTKYGVNNKCIVWNLMDKSEEVDIIMKYKGSLFIFELKDQDFDSGHAYPLSYRRVKYNASKIVIVTSGNVSKEVKKMFSELLNKHTRDEWNRLDLESMKPIYIEGLEELENGIKRVVKVARLLEINKCFEEFESITNIDIRNIFNSYFELYDKQELTKVLSPSNLLD